MKLIILTAVILFLFGCVDFVHLKSPEVYKFSEVPQLDVCVTDIKLIFEQAKSTKNPDVVEFHGINRYEVNQNATTIYSIDFGYLGNIVTDIKKMFKLKNAFKDDDCKITYEGFLTISKFKFKKAILEFEAEFKLVGIENGKDYYSFKEKRGTVWEDYCTEKIPCDKVISKKQLMKFKANQMQYFQIKILKNI